MVRLPRRQFLKWSAGAGLSMALGACAESSPETESMGSQSWGVPTEAQRALMLPQASTPERTLEVYLMGGLCPWDSFYVVPEHGKPAGGGPYAGQQWWTWQNGEDSVPEWFSRCAGEGRSLTEPFGVDSAGKTVHLGPWVLPFRDRPDIVKRMRVMVVSHPLAPHQAAVAHMLAGSARGASPGAHVQRYWRGVGDPARRTPYSYVLYPDSEFVAGFNVEAVSAVGSHSASARPLSIRMVRDNPLPRLLSREGLGDKREAVDDAIAHYLRRYRADLVDAATQSEVRSAILADYAFARGALHNAPALTSVLSPEVLAQVSGEACGQAAAADATRMSLGAAAHLLTNGANPARYVHVVDGGLVPAPDGGYDTHSAHVPHTSTNVTHTCRTLAEMINRPGEGDPKKLDLDRHQVLLTTEMGRTPYPQENSAQGLDHWPYGFVVVAIGGFVDEARAGVVGAIGEDGVATQGFTAPELRAGMLLAQGIWPFTPDSFRVGDVRNAKNELEAARLLRAALLGFPT